MTKTIAAGLVTALIMAAIGAFWMFAWLIGANGYSEAQGTLVLGGNLLLVLAALVAASLASAWFVGKLGATTAWSPWATVPLSVFVAVVLAIIAMIIGSLVIVLVVGSTP